DALTAKGGLFAPLQNWLLLKPVRAARQPGRGKWTSAEAPAFFAAANEYSATQHTIKNARDEATNRLGAFWAEGEADWDRIGKILAYGDRLHDLIAEVAGDDIDRLSEIRSKVGKLLAVATDMLGAGKPVGRKFAEL